MRDFRAEIRAIILKKEKPEPVKKQGCWHTRYALRKSATGSRFAVTVNKVKGHPIGKAFQDLHKKYEPQLAAAFLNVVKKIKSEIDLKELAQHVQARNVHHVVQTVIGDKFNSNLKGKFKSLLFEAYHAGAFIGASQLKNALVRKGGPGSGRYPAGQHTSFDDYRNDKDMIARQRAAEGLRAAFKDEASGTVFTGYDHFTAYQNYGRAHGMDKLNSPSDINDDNSSRFGFQTKEGEFITRAEAEKRTGSGESREIRRIGVPVGKALTASLDVTNQYAVDYLEDDLPTLIKEINESQAMTIQQYLLDGINNGEDGEEIASRIKNTIGLTQAQAQYVENFRTQIETGLDGSFTPIDERRLSVTQAQMAQDQFDSPDKDPAVVDALVENYAASLLAKRAMDISATQILQASREGQRNLWDDAVDQGYLDPAITRKHWVCVGDDRSREDHIAAQDMNEPDGIPMDGLYDTPWGPSQGPGDGPDEETINCRCVESLSFEDQWGTGTKAVEEEDADAEAE